MNSCFIVDRHGSFSDRVEDYWGEEGAVEGQSMLKHKATKLLLEEEYYEGLKGDWGMVKLNHYKSKAHSCEFHQLPSFSRFL